MPKSTNFQKISSDADLEAMFTEPVRPTQSMISSLTMRLNRSEQLMILNKCKDIYNEYGFKPTKAQMTLMYRKYIGADNE
jgi:hypothetical protein